MAEWGNFPTHRSLLARYREAGRLAVVKLGGEVYLRLGQLSESFLAIPGVHFGDFDFLQVRGQISWAPKYSRVVEIRIPCFGNSAASLAWSMLVKDAERYDLDRQ